MEKRETKETNEEIARLYRIIENELQKPEAEMDASLIAECSDFIEELREEQGDVPSIDYDKTLESIYAKLEGRDAAPSDAPPRAAQELRPKQRFSRRARILIRLSVAMVAVLVLMMGITVAAVRSGYGSAWEFIADNFQAIMDMSGGDTDESGSICIIVNDSSTEYASIEELLEKEQLDMMFPSHLPEGIVLQSVVQHDSDENNTTWTFQTSNERLSIVVHNHYPTPLDKYEETTDYQTDKLNFVIVQMDDHTYYAVAQHNGYEYAIHYDNYDELTKILTGMKEIDK